MAKNTTKIKNISKPVEASPQEHVLDISAKTIRDHAKSKWNLLDDREISWLLEFYQAPEVDAMLTEVQYIQWKIHDTRIRKIAVTAGVALSLFIIVFFSIPVFEITTLTMYGFFCLAFGSLVGTLAGSTNTNYSKLIGEQCTKAEVFSRLASLLNPVKNELESVLPIDIDVLVQKKFLKPFEKAKQESSFHMVSASQENAISLTTGKLISTRTWTDEKGLPIDRAVDHCYLLHAIFPTQISFHETDMRIQPNTSHLPKSTQPIHTSSMMVFTAIFIVLLTLYPQLWDYGTLTLGACLFTLLVAYAIVKKIQISQNATLQKTLMFDKLLEVRNTNGSLHHEALPLSFQEQLLKITKKQGNIFEFFLENNQIYVKRNLGHYEFLSLDTKALLPENQTVFIDWYIEMRDIATLLTHLPKFFSESSYTTEVDSKNGFTMSKLKTAQIS